jgi:hypothetical protein
MFQSGIWCIWELFTPPCGAIFIKSYVVSGLLGTELADSSFTLTSSPFPLAREVVEMALGRVLGGLFGAGADLATGSERPLSFPRLATPTPHVNCVLYPEHSFPISRHCEQYGRRRSHLELLLVHAKQSSEAPLAGALRRRLRCGTVGGSEVAHEEGEGHATGKVMVKKTDQETGIEHIEARAGRVLAERTEGRMDGGGMGQAGSCRTGEISWRVRRGCRDLAGVMGWP